MYFDTMTVAAIVVFVFAFGMFVKNCLVNNCILAADRDTANKDSEGEK